MSTNNNKNNKKQPTPPPLVVESKTDAKDDPDEGDSDNVEEPDETLLDKVTKAEAKMSVFDAVKAWLKDVPTDLVMTSKQATIRDKLRTRIYLDMMASISEFVEDIATDGQDEDDDKGKETADDEKKE